MEMAARPAHPPDNRYLVLLPAVIDVAAGPRVCRRVFSAVSHHANPAGGWRMVPPDPRRVPAPPPAAHLAGMRYRSDGNGRSWLRLASGRSDVQTLDRIFRPNTGYRLSLACADVSGCPDQRLTITLTGGASASATFAIPAHRSGQDIMSFVLCGLDFTPVSAETITVRLANSVVVVSTRGCPGWNRLRV